MKLYLLPIISLVSGNLDHDDHDDPIAFGESKTEKELRNAKDHEAVAKSAYCLCECCHDTSVCKRPWNVPEDYVCKPENCQREKCQQWATIQCKKHCYCSKCEGVIDMNDYRCIGFHQDHMADNCECDFSKIQCQKQTKFENEFIEAKTEAQKIVDRFREAKDIPRACFTKCYCDKCIESFTPKMVKTCKDNEAEAETLAHTCNCEEDVDHLLACPSSKNIERLEQIQPQLDQLEKLSFDEAKEQIQSWEQELRYAKNLAMSAGEKIESKEELKRNMCETTCLCDQCGDEIEGMKDRCKGYQYALKECDCNEFETVDCKIMKESVDCSTHCTCKRCGPQLEKLSHVGLDVKTMCSDSGKKTYCDCEKKDFIDCAMFDLPDGYLDDHERMEKGLPPKDKKMPEFREEEIDGMTIQIPQKDGVDVGNIEDIMGEIDEESIQPITDPETPVKDEL